MNAYGVKEMNHQEMVNVDGGNIFQTIGAAIESAVEAVGEFLGEVWDYVTTHTPTIYF